MAPLLVSSNDRPVITTVLQSPNGTEIEVKLVNFTKGLSVDGCSYAGVEIKTNEDQTLTGYRCIVLNKLEVCTGIHERGDHCDQNGSSAVFSQKSCQIDCNRKHSIVLKP